MALSSTALVNLIQAKNYIRVDPAASLHVSAEYVGMGDGATVVFTLDNTPVEGSLLLYVSGVLQAETDDYSIDGAEITFGTAPANGAAITAAYDTVTTDDTFEDYDDETLEALIETATRAVEEYTGRAFVQRSITEYHQGEGQLTLRLFRRPVVSVSSIAYKRSTEKTGDGEETEFDLGYVPVTDTLSVYVDDELQDDTAYSLSGQVVTFVSAPSDGAELLFRYQVRRALKDVAIRGSIGRLISAWGWSSDDEYVITYTAGYGTTREEVQALVPNAVTAALVAIAYWWENRVGAGSVNISGLGSVSYDGHGLPEESKGLLTALRMEF